MKYIKFLGILLYLSIGLFAKSQVKYDSVGVMKSTSLYALDSINNLSDSLVLQKFHYKNDSSLGYFIGYTTLGLKVANIEFRQNKNYQVVLYNIKGQMTEMIFLINDTIEEHLKFNGRNKLYEKVRLHVSGTKISETLYYKNGSIIYSHIYDSDGKLVVEKRYFKNGNLMYVFLYQNEIVIESHFYNRMGKKRK